jgi:putative SOS response-associated peptidase YedK
MCNDYRLEVDIASIMEDFDELEIVIDTPEGTPNVAAREDIKITDIAPIVASVEGPARVALSSTADGAGRGRRESPSIIIARKAGNSSPTGA